MPSDYLQDFAGIRSAGRRISDVQAIVRDLILSALSLRQTAVMHPAELALQVTRTVAMLCWTHSHWDLPAKEMEAVMELCSAPKEACAVLMTTRVTRPLLLVYWAPPSTQIMAAACQIASRAVFSQVTTRGGKGVFAGPYDNPQS